MSDDIQHLDGDPEENPDPAVEMAAWLESTTGKHLHPYQVQMLSDILSVGDALPAFETRGRNVMGPRMHSSDSILFHASPGEAMIPGPNGPIHIRGAYGNEPAQITEIDLDDIEGEQQ